MMMRTVFILMMVALSCSMLTERSRAQNVDDVNQLTIPPGLLGKRVPLADFGSEDIGYLVIPNTPPRLGIVLIPDAYGLDNFTLGEADRLSKQGYIVLAMDTYNGQTTTDHEKMLRTAEFVNQDAIKKTIVSAIRFFHESPRYRAPHVAVIGWGTGADAVLSVAEEEPKAKAPKMETAVLFYPSLSAFPHDAKKTKTTICALFPTHDPKVTHDNVIFIQKRMRKVANFDAWFIDAGERWSNPASQFYNQLEDGEAWKVAEGYLEKLAATPVQPEKRSIVDKIKNIF
jgi:carboxymethylenebutenolidase